MPSAPLIPKIPPLRTDIQEPQQSSAVNRPPAQGASNGANTASNGGSPQHRTSKEWYYYWSKVGEQVVQNTQTLGGLVTYGPHAGRPDPSTMPNGALAVESDRGAIYQNELINGVPTWFYVAGTMWGTLSPDQRPTDLGAHDAGFDFRTTDDPAREFIWSQAAWIEATPVRFGTHAARVAVVIAQVIDQMLWVETDRGNVIYQKQGANWAYVAGIMRGTLSPDQRPTGLGANDNGFQFATTDTYQLFVWSGSAWVEQTPANDVQLVRATGSLTLTTTAQDVPGATITLRRSGRYLIAAAYAFNILGAGDNQVNLHGTLVANGAVQSGQAYLAGAPATLAIVSNQWFYVASAPGVVVKTQAFKDSGAGTSAVYPPDSCLSALWVGP